MKKIILLSLAPFCIHGAAEEKKANSVSEEQALEEVLGAAHFCSEGKVAAKEILQVYQALIAQIPCTEQIVPEAAKAMAKALAKYDVTTLVKAGKFLLLSNTVGPVLCIKIHLAKLFIEDHSPHMITLLKPISQEGHALLALQILRLSGAEELFKERANLQYFEYSLLNYTALAHIVDVTAQIRAGKKVTLDPDKEPSFAGWVLNAMKNLIMNHNQELLALGGEAIKNCCTLL